MPSPGQLKLMENLLRLPQMKVIDYTSVEEVGMMVHLVAKQPKAVCPRCGKQSEKLHQNHWFLARDLPMGNQITYLKINRRQLKCERCQKPFSEDLDFVKIRRSYTKRLATQIVEQVLSSNIKAVAQQNNLSEDIVERMLKDAAPEKSGRKVLKS